MVVLRLELRDITELVRVLGQIMIGLVTHRTTPDLSAVQGIERPEVRQIEIEILAQIRFADRRGVNYGYTNDSFHD